MSTKVIAVSTFVTGFLLYIWHYSHWTRKRVKQRYQFPVFGDTFRHFFEISAYHDVLASLYRKFPDARYIGFYHYLRPGLMVRDPELIKQICIKDKDYFIDRVPILTDSSDELWSKNVFALQGEKWKEMRSALSPAFTGAKMRQIFNTVDVYAKKFCDALKDHPGDVVEIELKDLFTRFTTDVIATVAFGLEVNSLDDPDNLFYQKVKQAMLTPSSWKTFKLKLTLLLPCLAKIVGANIFDESVSEYFRDLIKTTIDNRVKNNIRRPDMLQLLMEVSDQVPAHDGENANRNPHFTVDDITSQALVFFLGGFETASNALCFMAYELALNTKIQDELIGEVDNYTKEYGALTYDGINKLNYMEMVLSETLRMWPPLLNLDRMCVHPYTIRPEYPNERPLPLKKETLIWIPVWAIHHDPKYWRNPEMFNPNRFSEVNKPKIDKGTYIPFGMGPRSCLGSRFATMEIKMLMFEILSRFRIVPVENSVIPFVPLKHSFNLASVGGFNFGLKKRFNEEKNEVA